VAHRDEMTATPDVGQQPGQQEQGNQSLPEPPGWPKRSAAGGSARRQHGRGADLPAARPRSTKMQLSCTPIHVAGFFVGMKANATAQRDDELRAPLTSRGLPIPGVQDGLSAALTSRCGITASCLARTLRFAVRRAIAGIFAWAAASVAAARAQVRAWRGGDALSVTRFKCLGLDEIGATVRKRLRRRHAAFSNAGFGDGRTGAVSLLREARVAIAQLTMRAKDRHRSSRSACLRFDSGAVHIGALRLVAGGTEWGSGRTQRRLGQRAIRCLGAGRNPVDDLPIPSARRSDDVGVRGPERPPGATRIGAGVRAFDLSRVIRHAAPQSGNQDSDER
jgi:hypothetical protein